MQYMLFLLEDKEAVKAASRSICGDTKLSSTVVAATLNKQASYHPSSQTGHTRSDTCAAHRGSDSPECACVGFSIVCDGDAYTQVVC